MGFNRTHATMATVPGSIGSGSACVVAVAAAVGAKCHLKNENVENQRSKGAFDEFQPVVVVCCHFPTALSYGLLCLAMAYFTHLVGESVLQVSSVDGRWNEMIMMMMVVVVRMKI